MLGLMRIFMSYSRRDSDVCLDMTSYLRKRYDATVWIDCQSIELGVSFASEIERGLREADLCIFLITEHSVQSLWVARELAIALELVAEGKLTIIPVYLDHSELIPQLAHLNHIDASRSNIALLSHELVKRLGCRLEAADGPAVVLHSSVLQTHPGIRKVLDSSSLRYRCSGEQLTEVCRLSETQFVDAAAVVFGVSDSCGEDLWHTIATCALHCALETIIFQQDHAAPRPTAYGPRYNGGLNFLHECLTCSPLDSEELGELSSTPIFFKPRIIKRRGSHDEHRGEVKNLTVAALTDKMLLGRFSLDTLATLGGLYADSAIELVEYDRKGDGEISHYRMPRWKAAHFRQFAEYGCFGLSLSPDVERILERYSPTERRTPSLRQTNTALHIEDTYRRVGNEIPAVTSFSFVAF